MTEQEIIDELDFGTKIFDDEGRELGHVRGFDEDGFYVTFREGIEGMSPSHIRAGTVAAGEAELMWRCYECGETGDIEDLPEGGCPSCGAAMESIYYMIDD